MNVYCDACKRNRGEIHVTVRVELFSTVSKRYKLVQFWLCPECERKNRMFLENSAGREGRVAQALAPTPAWMEA